MPNLRRRRTLRLLKKKKLDLEKQRLVEKMVQNGTRSGLGLSEAERERLTIWNKGLSQVCLKFRVSVFQYFGLRCQPLVDGLQENFNKENVSRNNRLLPGVRVVYYFQGIVSFTLVELKGVPEDVISGYAKRSTLRMTKSYTM